jgi:hypothetical protein
MCYVYLRCDTYAYSAMQYALLHYGPSVHGTTVYYGGLDQDGAQSFRGDLAASHWQGKQLA